MTNKPRAGRVTWVKLSNCHAGNIGPGHMGQIVIQSHIGQIVIFFLLPAFFFFFENLRRRARKTWVIWVKLSRLFNRWLITLAAEIYKYVIYIS